MTAAANLVAEDNLFWDLPDGAAPSADYDGSRQWLEWFVAPSLSLQVPQAGGWQIQGRASLLASGTLGSDAFAQGDTARLDFEDAWVAFERSLADQAATLRLSAGAQPLRLADGMLISNGGANGFERGALKLGPRKAWRDSLVIALTGPESSLRAFALSPNEQDSNRTGTRLWGLDADTWFSDSLAVGATWIGVARSRAPYPQAAPGGIGPPAFIENGRDGLRVLHGWAAWYSAGREAPGYFARLDAAGQRHGRIDLRSWAGRVRAGRSWDGPAGRWSATYAWQAFSGDDPNTARLERFDPLYYDGSPAAWASGSKSAMLFINSNVSAHSLALSLAQSNGRQITLRYARVSARELRSPIQFGQATRFDSDDGSTLVAGVTDAHLSDDLFLEFNLPLSQRLFLSSGASLSAPGRGIRRVFPSSDPLWSGAYVTLFFAY